MKEKIIEGFRLSPQQKHVWLLQQFDHSPAYRVQCAILIEGNLNTKVLKAALENVVNRHEILRTTFRCLPEMTIPLQVITDTSLLSVHEYNLSGWEPQEQDARVEALFHQARRLTFDLEKDPLLYISLVNLSPHKHILLVSLPALCADTATLKNLVREISRCYTASLHREELSEKPMQYVDFSEWQNELLEAQNTEIGREYWRKQELSALLTLKLPFENQPSGKPEFEPKFLTLTIKPDIVAKIEEFVRKYDTSTSVFLLASWQILLWHLTGQANISICSAYDNRNYEELKEALGLFAKYLPIPCELRENLQFSEILAQVNKTTSELYQWQECFSWEQIVDSIENVTVPSFFLFEFNFEEQSTKYSAPDVTFSIYKHYTCIERFKIKLCCVQRNNFLLTEFHYDSKSFSTENIKRLTEQFHTLLESVIKNPAAALDELGVLSDSERQQLLVEFNDTKCDYPKDKCIHQLFEEQAERTPDKIAVVFENHQVTYVELNARANQLARHLQELGVGPDVLVAICMERSLEMVVGLLGILKAGAAYVPLDPVLPKERLAFMLSDTQTPVLLIQQRLVENLPEHGAHVVSLDTDWDVIVQKSDDNFLNQATPENLVYVIYTSGSTGKPKGVAVEHQQLVNYLKGILDKLDLPAGASFATVSTFAADLGNTAIFPALCTGGCLHVISQERASDPDALAEYFLCHTIDCLKITPSHMAALMASSHPEQILPRQRLVLGGDASSWDLVEKIQALATDCLILNHYGPTEATVGTITYRVEKDQRDYRSWTLPLGRPLANTQIYLLNRHLQPVPMGVPGELHIGGAGLARGYLNRPDLTEEKFIPNPFSNEPRTRLYKTGDLARYLPDGNIEFLGRIDHQVKIRGFRIELGEIEVMLAQHPAVRETVVIAREDQPGDKHLVAYVVPSQEQLTTSELRRFLKELLPEYMLPSAFVMLEALPLTANGKVDRCALPAPETSSLSKETSFVQPRTPTQEVLAGIWTDILGVKVGIHDNFFELGGHSLLATQVISRVRKAFCVELPMRHLFELPTVAQLGESIQVIRQGGSGILAPGIEPVPRDEELPLSFAQARLWFLDQLEGGSATYNMPATLCLMGPLHVAALEQVVVEIVRRHEVLRTTFPRGNGKAVQVIAPNLTVTLPVVDLQALPENEQSTVVQQLATSEAQRPFDLSNDLLVRVTLLKLGEESHNLLVTMHHIVSDGWSIGIFIREVAALYEAFSKGAPSPLPDLSIQYADFAHWQRQWLTGEVLETQLNYWKQQLAGVAPLLSLPTDRPRPAVQTFRGGTKHFKLNSDLTNKLLTLSQQSGVTLFMTLLTAFVALLCRYSNQSDIVVGSPIANRNRTEIESLIGFFVNTLVLRTDLSGNPTFPELLARVRQVALDAYDHQDVPFEQLVEALQPERSLSHSPLFQVMFVLQNASMERLKLPGLTIIPLEIESVTAKFDLLLLMEETEQELRGSLEYNTDLFDAATIERMLGHFQTMLEAIVANPQQQLKELPLLTAAERHQLLVEWNDTFAEYPFDKCVHQLFEAQVEQTPDAVAVVFEDKQLTYTQLNAQANRLAWFLLEQGVGPDTTVALLAERSIDFLSAMMAVFKVGGAYLPVDPHHPAQRLCQVLQQSQTPLVLAASKFEPVVSQALGDLPSGKRPQVLLIEELLQQQQSEENLPVCCTASNLAYVIYTSGSTGVPKGAMVEHRGMLNHLYAKILDLKLTDADTVAQTARQSFDISVWQFLAALLVGGRVHIFNDEAAADPTQLLEQVKHQGISILEIVPSLLRMMLKQITLSDANRPNLSALRWLLLTGESLPPQLCRQWLEYYPGIPMLNAYGPTECSDDVTHYPISQPPAPEVLNIPIGRPVANTQLYVLDSQLQPVPIGVSGELYVGGIGVGRGYLNNAERTSEVFIADLFAQKPGARLYKTGDKARYLSDGNIEFLGRLDHQVKIRGFRIELGEIEAVLTQHPEVREVVVIAWEDQPDDKHLVAYVVPNQEVETQHFLSLLRRFLKEKLPDYMIPSAFVMLETLPLTPNGKVDRRALPAPDKSHRSFEEGFVPPRNSLEQQLVQIWEDVLDVHLVGVRDNFFELGGHSLLAVRLMAQIQQQFGKNLPLAALFQDPTIEHLASILRQHTDSLSWSPLVAIQPGGSSRPFFCVSGAGGNVLYFYDLARHIGSDQLFYGLQAVGLDGESEPYTRIEDIAAHYIEALQTIQPQGPYLLGGHSVGGWVAFEMAQQLLHQGQEVALVAILDTEAPVPGNNPVPVDLDEATWLTRIARLIERWVGKNLGVSYKALQPLDPDEQLNYLKERLTMVNLLPPEVGARQVRGLVQVFKANSQAQAHYVPHEVYPTRVTLFRAREVHLEDSELQTEILSEDPTWGWGQLSAEPVEIHVVPGDHVTMMSEPHVQVLAEQLRACLDKAQRMIEEN